MHNTAPVHAPTPASSKTATIQRLLDAARREFSDKGIAGARMEEIARAAGVTKQLVYHYFAGKEQLFACVLDAAADKVTAELLALELDHLPAREAMRALLAHAFDQYRADPALGSLAQQGQRYHDAHVADRSRFPEIAPALGAQVQRLLERGVRDGDFRADIDARLFHAATSLLVTGGFTNRYMVSAVAGIDLGTTQGIELWRDFAINFALCALLCTERPPLTRVLDFAPEPDRG
jgi:AcrR family transcriptional regulator